MGFFTLSFDRVDFNKMINQYLIRSQYVVTFNPEGNFSNPDLEPEGFPARDVIRETCDSK